MVFMVRSPASSPVTAEAKSDFGAGAARVALIIDDCVGDDGARTDHHRRNSRFYFYPPGRAVRRRLYLGVYKKAKYSVLSLQQLRIRFSTFYCVRSFVRHENTVLTTIAVIIIITPLES